MRNKLVSFMVRLLLGASFAASIPCLRWLASYDLLPTYRGLALALTASAMFTLFLISMYSTSTWRGVKWFRGAIMIEPKICPIGVYLRDKKFIAFGAKVFIMEDMGGCVRAITCNPVTRKMHYVTLRKKHLKVVQKKVCFDPTVLKMMVLDDHSWSSDQADEFLKGLKCN